jgi:hypothetical protein
MTIAVPALPGPVPQSTDPINFDARADATLGALPSVIAGMNAQNVENNALNLAVNVTAAAASAAAGAALDSAASAATSAGAQPWVSGANYAQGVVVFDPLDGRLYRRAAAGAGTTAPSADAANWRPRLLDVGTGLPKARPSLRFTPAATRSLDPRFVFTRASVGTAIGPLGSMLTLAANQPRFAHHPTTGECMGLLIEPAATNLLLNSATLATQTVTVTAAAHTLSFYGSGTVTLSGAADAVVAGVGVFPGYTTLTFTPSAGSLTLTVTGAVQFANLELGSFATSWVPTTGAAATRAADTATLSGADFAKGYRAGQGTFQVEILLATPVLGNAPLVLLQGASVSDAVRPLNILSTNVRPNILVGGQAQAQVNADGVPVPGAIYSGAISYRADNVLIGLNGGAVAQDTSATVPVMDRIVCVNTVFCVYLVRAINYWPTPLTAAELQAVTAIN